MQLNLSPIDRDMLIRTVIGEAANEPLQGQAGVVSVILNRLASGKHGKDVQDVVFAKHQFEPWDTRRSELLGYRPESETYQRAASVVDAVLNKQIEDPTAGATHFLNPDVVKDRRGGSLPDWAQGEGTAIGQHTFYAPEGRVQLAAATGPTPVTDPAVLEAFGAEEPAEAAPAAAMPVTDPAILEVFGMEDNVPRDETGRPTAAPGIPAAPILPGQEVGVGGAFVQGFASNEQEALRALAQSLYPNEPIEQAVQRFGKEAGVLYHVADDGQRYRVDPEFWSGSGMLNNMAQGAGQAIPTVAGAATGIATAPMAMAGPAGLLGSLAATGAAAGGGEYARQKLGDMMMGEEASTGEISPWQVASEGISSLAGQGAGATFGRMATRGAVRDIARYDPVATQQAYADAAAIGMSLSPAEATNLASLKAQQKRLANTMETADTMAEWSTRRDTQLSTAWNGFMDTISVSADAENVGRLARDAAGGVLSEMRRALQTRAQPVYDLAFGTVRDPSGRAVGYQRKVPLTPVLDGLLKRPVMKDALEKAATLAKNEGINFNPADIPDARGWDIIKQGLDDILDSPAAKNERTGGVNNYGRIVAGVKRDMLAELDTINPDYAAARAIYSGGAEDMTDAMQSALKIVADTKDTSILSAARHIFDPKTRSPNMIVKLRTAIEGKDPAAWQAVKRLYIQNVGMDALRLAEQGGEVLNQAGKLHKAFSNDRMQENLRAAMTPDERQRMTLLLVNFKRASRVPAMGSDTAYNLWARDAERAAAEGPISKVMKNVNPAQALRNLAEWRTTRRIDRNSARVAEIITSDDPNSMAALRELRRLSPMDRNWLLILGHLIGQQVGPAAAGALIPEPDYQPGGGVGGGAY